MELCEESCYKNHNCTHFTYSIGDSKCYLKNGSRFRAENKGSNYISGQRVREAEQVQEAPAVHHSDVEYEYYD